MIHVDMTVFALTWLVAMATIGIIALVYWLRDRRHQ
jgi:hypothetical protein